MDSDGLANRTDGAHVYRVRRTTRILNILHELIPSHRELVFHHIAKVHQIVQTLLQYIVGADTVYGKESATGWKVRWALVDVL